MQIAYMEKAAVAHSVDPNLTKGPKKPMDNRFTVSEGNVPAEEDVNPALRTKIKSILGSVLFPTGWCRPEAGYAAVWLSRYAARPWPAIKDEAIRLLKYLVITKHRGIKFSRNPDDLHRHKLNELYSYVDSLFADDPPMRR
eukprot:3242336-Rhodomonas_salina.2